MKQENLMVRARTGLAPDRLHGETVLVTGAGAQLFRPPGRRLRDADHVQVPAGCFRSESFHRLRAKRSYAGLQYLPMSRQAFSGGNAHQE
jgi:hypothetical protein